MKRKKKREKNKKEEKRDISSLKIIQNEARR